MKEENKSPCLSCSLGAKGINYCCPCVNYEKWLKEKTELITCEYPKKNSTNTAHG